MKQPSPSSIERVAKMTVASVYPMYLSRIEKHGRTQAELNQVIEWLTGYDEDQLNRMLEDKTSFGDFYDNCTLNPNAEQITGVVCGYRIEDIENEFMRKCRYLDKMVDELARGRKMDKILRSE